MRTLTMSATDSLAPRAKHPELDPRMMRLLIVDDNRQLAELTAELLRRMDRNARNIGAISVAGDLGMAIQLLPHQDAILCEGQFPTSPNFWYRDDQWTRVQSEAVKFGILFILYSGNPESLDAAQERGLAAIPKPSRIEHLYAALMHQWHGECELKSPCVATD